jgi:hypothetical protein
MRLIAVTLIFRACGGDLCDRMIASSIPFAMVFDVEWAQNKMLGNSFQAIQARILPANWRRWRVIAARWYDE